MATLPPGLIWLASYPKSGNTWMRVLLANLLHGGDAPRDINNLFEDEALVSRWRFGDELLVDSDLFDAHELAELRRVQYAHVGAHLIKAAICKTHDRFDAAMLGAGARCALYLVRDPRDVAISLAHHLSVPIDVAIAQMTDPEACSGGGRQLRYPIGDWGRHVSGWAGQQCVACKVVRYETLSDRPAATLADILRFLDGAATDDEIARAVRHSSFEALQRQEVAKGFREALPGQQRFFRKGRVGEWREALSLRQVRAIEAAFAPEMQRWGYALAD